MTMNREQQISDAAQMCDITANRHDLDCFAAGARWADATPADTDIIGTDFEPPYKLLNNCINNVSDLCDATGKAVLIMTRDSEDEAALAQHICDLLNRERGEGENQRREWLSKCCDVVRNTRMDEDLKSHLINTFMRL